jgi:hypothetical protein
MEWMSSVSTQLISMVDRNISGVIKYDSTTSRELLQSVGARVIETMIPNRCGAGSSSNGIACGRLKRTRGKKTDGVQWPKAITHDDHVPGSMVLHR